MITNNKKERLTSQKKIILDYLKEAKTHPTAREVYSAIRKKLPRISLATVYRILEDFGEKNQAQKIFLKISHYDGDLSLHSHFICEECQKIFDVFEDFNNELGIKNKKIKVGKIKKYQIYIYGICKKCQKK
jgi:Fur family transcriptional regulator, peroxide stress response regulator